MRLLTQHTLGLFNFQWNTVLLAILLRRTVSVNSDSQYSHFFCFSLVLSIQFPLKFFQFSFNKTVLSTLCVSATKVSSHHHLSHFLRSDSVFNLTQQLRFFLDLKMGKGSPTPESQMSHDDLTKLYMADKYVCTLSPDLLKVAKKELREDDKTRTQALEQMREWILKTNYIKDCRLDANFLLRFLRCKKFSVPMAQENLLKYIAMRQQHSHWFHNTGLSDPIVMDLVNRGVAFALPKRDQFGRRVLFTVGGNIDPEIHTSESVMKAIMVVFESLLEDEENQIRGFSHCLDESGITVSHLVLWNPSEISRIFGTTEKAMPMRHKRLDFICLPQWLTYVLDFAKSLMTDKLRSRIRLHKDHPALWEHLDRKILPKEYGGEMPMSEMIQLFKNEVADSSARLLALDNLQLDLDLMKKSSSAPKKVSSDILGMTGSFKKLEFD